MVTKILHVLPTAAAVDDKENRVETQLLKEGDDGDKKCAPTKETSEIVQIGRFGASDICHGHLKHDVSALSKPTDGTSDEGKLAASASAIAPLNNDAKKKRSLATDNKDHSGRKKSRKMCIDLSDVPAKPPILKGSGKSGSSKYQGVCFLKANNKWQAQIMIEGKRHYIGHYDNEDEAAADYARAVFKYAQKKPKAKGVDLSDVPAKPLILRSDGKSGTSKHQGVSFNKATNKWMATLTIDGKQRVIGYYDTEEDAAADYARAVFKYAPKKLVRIYLNDVPAKPPILKVGGKSGSSKYQGVTFHKARNKWEARITIDGKKRHIGYYDNEDEAAADYARAVCKYKEGTSEVARPHMESTDVSEKLSVLKGSDKCETSQFKGVFASSYVGDGVGPQGMMGGAVGRMAPGVAMGMHPALRSGGRMASTHMMGGWKVPATSGIQRHPSSMPFSLDGAPAGVAAFNGGVSSNSVNGSQEMPQQPESEFSEQNRFAMELSMKHQTSAVSVVGRAGGSSNQELYIADTASINESEYEI